MKIYYIKNTIDEYRTTIRGYFTSLTKAKEALKDCCDWYRSYGTGRIYAIEANNLHALPELVYEN